jgi:putative transcriptional regulator
LVLLIYQNQSLDLHISLRTLRSPEHGRKEPDAVARAYLTVIGRGPEAVGRALGAA